MKVKEVQNKDLIYQQVKERVENDEKRPKGHMSASCFFFAIHGVQLLKQRGFRALLQAGTCSWPRVRRDQDDGKVMTHFSYTWSPEDARSRVADQMGFMKEVHIWIGLPEPQQIVDFTSGLFPEQAKKLCGMDWPGDLPPKYLWATYETLPNRVVYQPSMEAIQYVFKLVAQVYGRDFLLENML